MVAGGRVGRVGLERCEGGAVEVGKGNMVGEVRTGEGHLTVSCPDEPGPFPPVHPTPPRCGVQWLLFSEVTPVHYAPSALPASGLLRMRVHLPCPLTSLRLRGLWLRGTCQALRKPGVVPPISGVPSHQLAVKSTRPAPFLNLIGLEVYEWTFSLERSKSGEAHGA